MKGFFGALFDREIGHNGAMMLVSSVFILSFVYCRCKTIGTSILIFTQYISKWYSQYVYRQIVWCFVS